MKRPPFKMKPSEHTTLSRDGQFVCAGRASFVWETFLLARAAGVPGEYRIRKSYRDAPWHVLRWSMDEAVEALQASTGNHGPAAGRVRRALNTRAARVQRGLEVA